MRRNAVRRRRGRARTPPIVYWVRSVGPEGKDRVAMYYKGVLRRDSDEGMRGDLRARPVSLGDGPYTAVYGRYDFEHEDGSPLFAEPHRTPPWSRGA